MGARRAGGEPSGFGERMRELRIAAGLSQGGLSERAGLNRHALARLERGEQEPSWITAVKLADALGVSVAAFRPTGEPVVKPVADAAEAAAPEGERVRKPGKRATGSSGTKPTKGKPRKPTK